jgi:hypothetical protein
MCRCTKFFSELIWLDKMREIIAGQIFQNERVYMIWKQMNLNFLRKRLRSGKRQKTKGQL